MADLPAGYLYEDYSELREVCAQHSDGSFAEGDEGAIYCVACSGYRCDACGGTGQAPNGPGTKRCYACSGFGVVMGWPEFPYRINPWNWAKATQEAAGRSPTETGTSQKSEDKR